MTDPRDRSVWDAPGASLGQQRSPRGSWSLLRSVALGAIVAVVALVVLSVALSLALQPSLTSMGIRVTSLNDASKLGEKFPILRYASLVLWWLSLGIGGFASAWSRGDRWAVVSCAVGAMFALALGALTLSASGFGWQFLGILCVLPAAIAGGFLASRVAGA